MATNLKAKRQKLYFDVSMGTSLTCAAFVCTQFTAGTQGDRYGNLLTALQALTGSAPSAVKAKNTVSAWFSPNSAGVTAASPWSVDFVGPTAGMVRGPGSSVTQAAVAALAGLPYMTAGTLTPIAALAGHDPIYSVTVGFGARHFAVRLRRRGTALSTMSGTVYVQRQHSIEV